MDSAWLVWGATTAAVAGLLWLATWCVPPDSASAVAATGQAQALGVPPNAMDTDAPLAKILACSVCMGPLADAQVTACGHSFCGACAKRLAVCPLCRQDLRAHGFTPNHTLRAVVDALAEQADAGDRLGPPLERLERLLQRTMGYARLEDNQGWSECDRWIFLSQVRSTPDQPVARLPEGLGHVTAYAGRQQADVAWALQPPLSAHVFAFRLRQTLHLAFAAAAPQWPAAWLQRWADAQNSEQPRAAARRRRRRRPAHDPTSRPSDDEL